MVVEHATLGHRYDVAQTVANDIRAEVRRQGYETDDSFTLPFVFRRLNNVVAWAGWDVMGGPQGDTNGHGQTGATSSNSAASRGANDNLNGQANGSTGSSNGNNGPTGTS